MPKQSKERAAWLTLRIFMPSAVSLALCVATGVAALLLHVVAIGFNHGAVFGNFLDGQWAQVYGHYFRGPLNDFLALTTLNSLLEVVLWGCIGLVVYTLAERAFRSFSEWREAERNVQLIAPGQVVQHPLERPFYLTLAWRALMTVLFMIWIGVALAMTRQLVGVDGLAFGRVDTEHFNSYLLSLAVQWTLLAYALVILIRLALRRSRIYGRQANPDRSGFFQE